MNDPHVQSLTYRLKPKSNISFNNCPKLNYSFDDYDIELLNDVLTCTFKTHFPDKEATKKIIEPFLKSWELDIAIRNGCEEFNFVFESADIIERKSAKGSKTINSVSAQAYATVNASIQIHVTRTNYPQPPNNFETNPDVETLWYRYKQYKEGREQLTSMGYFCCTYIKYTIGSKEAQEKYRISKKVITTLSKLTSAHGNSRTARKVQSNGENIPLTSNEIRWIEVCIQKLIHRLGEQDPAFYIDLSELPKI